MPACKRVCSKSLIIGSVMQLCRSKFLTDGSVVGNRPTRGARAPKGKQTDRQTDRQTDIFPSPWPRHNPFESARTACDPRGHHLVGARHALWRVERAREAGRAERVRKGGRRGWNSRAPARQAPSPEERHPVYPKIQLVCESTPKNAPRLPIQTNNHTTSELHTHVMSNENKFPSKRASTRRW